MTYRLEGLREVQRLPDEQGGAIVVCFDHPTQSWPLFNDLADVLRYRAPRAPQSKGYRE